MLKKFTIKGLSQVAYEKYIFGQSMQIMSEWPTLSASPWLVTSEITWLLRKCFSAVWYGKDNLLKSFFISLVLVQRDAVYYLVKSGI